MAQKHVVLRAQEHGDHRVADTTDWRLVAGREMFIPVDVTELAAAAREYPLFFLKDKAGLFALTWLEKGINAYVGKDGVWKADYIPARLRIHPFLLAVGSGEAGNAALAVKADAPEFGTDNKGHRLFINGVPSDFVKKRAAMLANIRKAVAATEKAEKLIRSFDLIEDLMLNVKFQNGASSRLVGLQRVNEKKLYELARPKFMQLRDEGALPVVYAHLLSMPSLVRGPLAERYPSLRQPAVQNNAASDILEMD